MLINYNKICFKFNMNKYARFSEDFLASILSISKERLHKTATLLRNSGEIMFYGDNESREYRLEDVYVLLTKHTKNPQIKALNQFKNEFFHA